MRKPRDYDAEMQALNDRTKQVKERKVQQLGELVIACSADALPVEQLAGALLAAVTTTDPATKEGWRERGAAFFQRSARRTAGGTDRAASGKPEERGTAQPPAGGAGA